MERANTCAAAGGTCRRTDPAVSTYRRNNFSLTQERQQLSQSVIMRTWRLWQSICYIHFYTLRLGKAYSFGALQHKLQRRQDKRQKKWRVRSGRQRGTLWRNFTRKEIISEHTLIKNVFILSPQNILRFPITATFLRTSCVLAGTTETSNCAAEHFSASSKSPLKSLCLPSVRPLLKILFISNAYHNRIHTWIRINVARRSEGRCILNHTAYVRSLSNTAATQTRASGIALSRLASPQWRRFTLSPGYQYNAKADVCTKAADEHTASLLGAKWSASDGTDRQTHDWEITLHIIAHVALHGDLHLNTLPFHADLRAMPRK
jgi:hypothetical protein